MQTVEPYKRETILSALFSLPAIVAVACMAGFWFTIASYDAETPNNTSTAAKPDLRNAPDIVERADSMKPMQLAQSGKPQEAIQAANILLKKQGHDALANLSAGDAFIAAGVVDDGLRYLKLGVGLSHRNKWACRHYAQKLAEVGKDDEAITQYQGVIHMDPNWDAPHLELAQLYMAKKANNEAAEELKAVCALDDKNFAVRKLRGIALARAGNLKGGLEEYVMATQLENQSGIPEMLRPILGAQGNAAISRATFELQQRINQRPEDYLPKLRLAQLYAYSGDAKSAKDLLVEARRAAPNNVEVQRTLAIVLKTLGEDNPALSSFGLSVKLEEQQKTPGT